MVYLFVASILTMLLVGRLKRIELISTYTVFLASSLLYNLAPFLLNRTGLHFYSLHADTEVIDCQLALTSVGNVFLALAYFLFYKRVRYEPPDVLSIGWRRQPFVWFAVAVFVLATCLCFKYGWHQYTHALEEDQPQGMMFTLTAYVKDLFVGVYLYYLARFGLDRYAWLLFAEHALLMLVDGGRVTFFPLMWLTMYLYTTQRAKAGLRTAPVYWFLAIGVLLSVLTRAIFIGGSVGAAMLQSVAVEGGMGAYPSLQTVFLLLHQKISYFLYGTNYLIDPAAWFLPQGSLRDSVGTFSAWIKSVSPSLYEPFAPMGGFYYVSEAIAAFSYIGPAIVGFGFGCCAIFVERNKNLYRLLFLAFVATIGVLFSKTIFANVMKLFLIQMVILSAFRLCERTSLSLPRFVLMRTPSISSTD